MIVACSVVILNIFRHYTVMHLVGLSVDRYRGFQTVARRVQPDRKKNGGPIPVDFQSTLRPTKCMTGISEDVEYYHTTNHYHETATFLKICNHITVL